MRTAVMVSGILGVVLVFAVGLVALAVERGPSHATAASAGTQDSNVTKASHPTSGSPTATAKASPKATASRQAKKTAAAGSTRNRRPALLTVPAGWKLDVRSKLLRHATEHRHVGHLL